jgi:hypothetical protein
MTPDGFHEAVLCEVGTCATDSFQRSATHFYDQPADAGFGPLVSAVRSASSVLWVAFQLRGSTCEGAATQ